MESICLQMMGKAHSQLGPVVPAKGAMEEQVLNSLLHTISAHSAIESITNIIVPPPQHIPGVQPIM